MIQDPNKVTYFAEANARNQQKRFGIKRKDRTKHMYIIGKTGMGKTTLLENMAIQDILNGEGLGIIDPHGDFAEKMLNFVPESRIEDVLYFAPSDLEHPIGFNIMENVDPTMRHLIANGMMGVFKKIWPDVWSSRMEYILNNCILALLETPGSTILGINRMLSDKAYRKTIVNNVSDTIVRAFWIDEFGKYSDKFAIEAGAAIQNKIGQFISNPLVRNIIGQPKSSFNLREVMDQKKIFIMNLSKGRMGEDNARLIGAMLITKLYLAAMGRVDTKEEDRKDFYLYVDEFQNFATESFKDILSEARKYKLSLILAHQYIAQMEEVVRDAVFGNVGTQIAFRVGAYDAEVLEKEFSPEFYIQDIVNLGFASIYLKLMIDGVASRPFSATTLPPIQVTEEVHTEEIIEVSRKKYSIPKQEAIDAIEVWSQPVDTPATSGASVREQAFGSGDRDVELHRADCAVCGKEITVPFKPDGKRPIYCPTHRKQAQAETAQAAASKPQVVPAPVVQQASPTVVPPVQQTPSPQATPPVSPAAPVSQPIPQIQKEVVQPSQPVHLVAPQAVAPVQSPTPQREVVVSQKPPTKELLPQVQRMSTPSRPPQARTSSVSSRPSVTQTQRGSTSSHPSVPSREGAPGRRSQESPQRKPSSSRSFTQNRPSYQRKERTMSLGDLSRNRKVDVRSDELRKALSEALSESKNEVKKDDINPKSNLAGGGKTPIPPAIPSSKPAPSLSANGKAGVIKPGEKISFDR